MKKICIYNQIPDKLRILVYIGLSHLLHWNYTEFHHINSSLNIHVLYGLTDLLWLFPNIFNSNVRHVNGRAAMRLPSTEINSEV